MKAKNQSADWVSARVNLLFNCTQKKNETWMILEWLEIIIILYFRPTFREYFGKILNKLRFLSKKLLKPQTRTNPFIRGWKKEKEKLWRVEISTLLETVKNENIRLWFLFFLAGICSRIVQKYSTAQNLERNSKLRSFF